MLEYTWMIPKIGKDQIIKGHLAWANGDTTGKPLCLTKVWSMLTSVCCDRFQVMVCTPTSSMGEKRDDTPKLIGVMAGL